MPEPNQPFSGQAAIGEEWQPLFTPEQIATPPSFFPERETSEAREMREAEDLPEPPPLKYNRYENLPEGHPMHAYQEKHRTHFEEQDRRRAERQREQEQRRTQSQQERQRAGEAYRKREEEERQRTQAEHVKAQQAKR